MRKAWKGLEGKSLPARWNWFLGRDKVIDRSPLLALHLCCCSSCVIFVVHAESWPTTNKSPGRSTGTFLAASLTCPPKKAWHSLRDTCRDGGARAEKKASWDRDLSVLGEQLDNLHLSSNPASPMNTHAVVTDPGALFCETPKQAAHSSEPATSAAPRKAGPSEDGGVDALARNLFGEFSKLSDPDSANNNDAALKNPFLLCGGSLTVRGDDSESQTGNKDKCEDSTDLTSRNGSHSLTAVTESSDVSSQCSDGDYLTANEDSDGSETFEDCVDPMVFPDSDCPTRVFLMG